MSDLKQKLDNVNNDKVPTYVEILKQDKTKLEIALEYKTKMIELIHSFKGKDLNHIFCSNRIDELVNLFVDIIKEKDEEIDELKKFIDNIVAKYEKK